MDRCMMRSFSLPSTLSNRLDQFVDRVRLDSKLVAKLNLNAASPPPLEVDQRGLTATDYQALQKLLHSEASGDNLIKLGWTHPMYSHAARSLVVKAQRHNLKAKRREELTQKTANVNFSRVVAALLLKGLETLETDHAATAKSAGRTRRDARKAA